MDLKAAYLHPERDKEVFIEQPKKFEHLDSDSNKIHCKLEKSIYGLRQTVRNLVSGVFNYFNSARF